MKNLIFLLILLFGFLTSGMAQSKYSYEADTTKIVAVTVKEGNTVFGHIYQTDKNGILLKSTDVGFISFSWDEIKKISEGIYSRRLRSVIAFNYADYFYMTEQSSILPLRKSLSVSFTGYMVPTQITNFMYAEPFHLFYWYNKEMILIAPLSFNYQSPDGMGIEAGFVPNNLISPQHNFDFYVQPKYAFKLADFLYVGLELTHFRFRQFLAQEDSRLGNLTYSNYFNEDTLFHNRTSLVGKLTIGHYESNLTFSIGKIYENYTYLKEMNYSFDTLKRNELLNKPLFSLSGIVRVKKNFFLFSENKLIPTPIFYSYFLSIGSKILTRKMNIDFSLAIFRKKIIDYYGSTMYNALTTNIKFTYKIR